MNTQPYNKPFPAGIHPFTDASKAPAGEACKYMGRPKQPDFTREQRIEKLMANCEPCPTTGCWLWTGKLNSHGYGLVCHTRKVHFVHRESFILFKGPITEQAVDHLCNNRSCFNPLHLDQCSVGENVRRGAYRRVMCKRGLHLLVDANISLLKSGRRAGTRICKECMRIRNDRFMTPEIRKRYNATDRAKHKEKRDADKRIYYAANRDKICARQREYERKKFGWKPKAQP